MSATMKVASEILADRLGLPDEVTIRGARYDPFTNTVELVLDGTGYDGEVSPTFAIGADGSTELVSWGRS